MNYTNYIILASLIFMISCNHQSKNTISEFVANNDSTNNVVVTVNNLQQDTLSEDFIADTLLSAPEVKRSNTYIDSFSNHKHGIAFMINKPSTEEKNYTVIAGYDGEERFETYYHFFINPTSKQITIYDVDADDNVSLEQWRKNNKE